MEKIKTAGGPEAAGEVVLLSRIREVAEQAKIKLSTELGNIAALRKDPKTGLNDAATKMNDILATG